MLDHLEDNIRRVIADIRPQMLEKVIENWTSRLNYIRASRGSPMPEIIFKISIKRNRRSIRRFIRREKQQMRRGKCHEHMATKELRRPWIQGPSP
ncbi:hypothetical protein TNCV_1654621 [Trichonephila clavipes]|nr:hypothetical protein TNCV_1654621 [Trichonephila clavipes]